MNSKKILITGAFGFIGSHLANLLIKEGYEVIAFDRYNINNNYGWLEKSKYKNNIKFILGDIRDYDSVHKAMEGCNICIHLAALIGIPYSYISPLAYLKTNIEGTYNVLESAKNLNLDQILITSTSEVYGSAQYLPIDEKHPMVGQSPYAASKISADQIALSYYMSFNLPVKVVRPFNVYGPFQSSRAIIPTIISQLLLKKDKINLGNIEVKRDFTYVSDTCHAFLSILKSKNLYGEVVNVGMGQNISIEDLFKLLRCKMEVKSEIIIEKARVRPKASEVKNLLSNNNKLVENTSWVPKYDFSQGLDETITWIKSNFENYKPEIYHV